MSVVIEPRRPISGLNVDKGIHDIRASDDRPTLSVRQRQCLRGVLQLKSAKQIARDLGISPHVVEKHLKTCRDKYGVSTTAEAARIFSLEDKGADKPPGDSSDLAQWRSSADDKGVPGRSRSYRVGRLKDFNGALSLDHPLSPRQTLLTIAAVSFGSIVGLLLLVACAEALRSLVSH